MIPNILVMSLMLAAVVIGWLGVVRLTRTVRQTSLQAAAWWSVWSQLTLTVAAIASVAKSRLGQGLFDQIGYFAAVSALCPFIAVLGARRGRLVDWSLFVVLPLVVVLEWPALAQWSATWQGKPLELELPSLLGYSVVMLMGAGNFIGTRFTWAAAAWIAGWLGTVWNFGHGSDSRSLTSAFGLSMTIVFWVLGAAAVRKPSAARAWVKIWADFRDHFGSVWALRLLARVNEVAQRDRWPWLLTPDGWKPNAASGSASENAPDSDPRVVQTFRWQLKPFVDAEWIDAHWRADPTVSATATPPGLSDASH